MGSTHARAFSNDAVLLEKHLARAGTWARRGLQAPRPGARIPQLIPFRAAPTSNTPEALVVGAGISGLAAAHALQKAGCAVRVLEANDHPGERMVTVDWEGFRFDAGAKFVTTSDKSLLALVHEVGWEDKLVRSREGLPIVIYRDGKLHAARRIQTAER